MKIKFLTLFFIIGLLTTYGQSPQAFSFQGLSLNAAGQPNKDRNITVQVKILKGSTTGVEVYKEVHLVTTNSNGLYSLSVGKGTVQNGKFTTINWGSPPYFISVGIDENALSNFVLAGTTELLSVPYALYAENTKIRPKIAVFNSPLLANPTIFASGEASSSSIVYYYEWIQGDPEDVIIDFIGLPDNVNIITNNRGGFGLPAEISNASKTDTIKGGFIVPASRFTVRNTALNLPSAGTYPIKLRFRTKTEVLDSLNLKLVVQNNAIESCFTAFPLRLPQISSTCKDLDSFIVKNITVNKLGGSFVVSTNLFDPIKSDTFAIQPNTCNGSFNVTTDVLLKNGSRILLYSMEMNQFTQKRFKYRINYSLDGRLVGCEVIY